MSDRDAIFSPAARTPFKLIGCSHVGCGHIFAVPVEVHRRFLDTHEWFYCPAGHQNRYAGENQVALLTRAIEQERIGHAATREQLDRLRSRVQFAAKSAQAGQ